MDDIGSTTLTLIYDMSINLGGLYVSMSEHSLNSIDIRITFKLQSCESVADKVKKQICERGIISKYE